MSEMDERDFLDAVKAAKDEAEARLAQPAAQALALATLARDEVVERLQKLSDKTELRAKEMPTSMLALQLANKLLASGLFANGLAQQRFVGQESGDSYKRYPTVSNAAAAFGLLSTSYTAYVCSRELLARKRLDLPSPSIAPPQKELLIAEIASLSLTALKVARGKSMFRKTRLSAYGRVHNSAVTALRAAYLAAWVYEAKQNPSLVSETDN